MEIPHGSTNRNVFFVAVDATDLKTRETGLTGFTVRYQLDDGAETGMTTPTVTEVHATNQPGVYRLLIDESGMTTLTAGNDTEELVLHITHASMSPVTRVVQIYRPKFTEGQTANMASSAVDANVELWRDVVPNALVSNRVDSSVGAMAANVLTAAAINADAITAAKVAADVGLEFADAVWDEAKAGHVAAGSFGEEVQQLAKPGECSGLWMSPISQANAQCHFVLRVVDAAGATVTGLTIGSFTWSIFNQDLTSIGDPAQLDEVASGLYLGYFVTLDPTAHIMRVIHTTHFPAGLVGASASYDATLDTLATSVPQEVWNKQTSAHVIAGSFGKAVGDILVDTGTDIPALIVSETNAVQADILALNDLSIADVTGVVGNSLEEIGLHFLVNTAVTGPDVVNNSIFAKLVSDQSPADFDDLDTTTSLSGIAGNLGIINSNVTITVLQTDDIPGDVQSGLTAQGYTGARAVKLDNLDIPVSTLVDLVLDEALAGHLTAGTVGEALSLISDALETFKNRATVVVEGGGTKLVTIYETDDTTVKYQVRISADGLTRTRL